MKSIEVEINKDMNKRIRKKKHKELIASITYAISVSSIWRGKLFELDDNNTLEVNRYNHIGVDYMTVMQIKRWNLRYCIEVSRISNRNEITSVVFNFYASEFTEIKLNSFNNPSVV